MTVRELLARIDSVELSEWVAYLKIERERDEKPEAVGVEDALRKMLGGGGGLAR